MHIYLRNRIVFRDRTGLANAPQLGPRYETKGKFMRKFLLSAGVVLVAVLLSALPSKADSVANFSVGALDLTFSLPDTFTPASLTATTATTNNISGTLLGGNINYGEIVLGSAGFMGMTNYWAFGSVAPSPFSGPWVGFFSPTLLTFNSDGTVTINPGVYSFGAVGGPSITLDVTTTGDGNGGGVTTPEPASLTLLGMGGLALMGLRRRKTA